MNLRIENKSIIKVLTDNDYKKQIIMKAHINIEKLYHSNGRDKDHKEYIPVIFHTT